MQGRGIIITGDRVGIRHDVITHDPHIAIEIIVDPERQGIGLPARDTLVSQVETAKTGRYFPGTVGRGWCQGIERAT